MNLVTKICTHLHVMGEWQPNNVCVGFAEGGWLISITNHPITCFHQASSKDRVKSHDVRFIVICVRDRMSSLYKGIHIWKQSVLVRNLTMQGAFTVYMHLWMKVIKGMSIKGCSAVHLKKGWCGCCYGRQSVRECLVSRNTDVDLSITAA